MDQAARLMVINAGSSSLKFKLFSASPLVAGISGLIERIGDASNSTLSAKVPRHHDGADAAAAGASAEKVTQKLPVRDHASALEHVMRFLADRAGPSAARAVAAVGHRVVHGLDISRAVAIDAAVLAKIEAAAALAPLHNPPGLAGIAAARAVFGSAVPQVAVFDTAFHQTLPPKAYRYALPREWYERHAVRRYGFHGTSHKYLAEMAAAMLGVAPADLNAITCHLGNGSSVTAVAGGASVDTSMGLTPLEGLVMGTRCGDVDAAVPLHLMRALGLSAEQMDAMLNKKSGLLGLCGDSDVRSVIERRAAGDPDAALALDAFVYRVRKYVGAYTVTLGGRVDALVFSAGIGENSPLVRALVCEGLEAAGIELDPEANARAVGEPAVISAPSSRVRVLVVPADEELSIARQTLEVVAGGGGGVAAGSGGSAAAASPSFVCIGLGERV